MVIGSGWAGTTLVKHLDSDKFNITVISNNLEFVLHHCLHINPWIILT